MTASASIAPPSSVATCQPALLHDRPLTRSLSLTAPGGRRLASTRISSSMPSAKVTNGDQRLSDALQRLAAEPAADEGAEALVGIAATRQHEVERHPELAGPGEER